METGITLKRLFKNVRKINNQEVEGKDQAYYEAGKDTACSTTIGNTVYSIYDGSSNFWEWCLNFMALRVGIYGSAIGYDIPANKFFIQQCREFDLTKRRVFGGISRGGAILPLVVIRFLEMCERDGVKPDCKVVIAVNPKSGGYRYMKKFKDICERNDVEVIRITMDGDIVPNFVLWWRGHWETLRIKLKNKERGLKNKHKNFEKYLPDMLV